MTSPSVALDGRSLGRRGTLTRRRLLDATRDLLETRGLRDLRVVDIARAAGTSPATFYQYFRAVEDAVLVLAEEAAEDLGGVLAGLDEPWSDESSHRMVDAFVDSWSQHRAVLRTRNLAAQEGDQRFRAVRNASLRPITEALAAKIGEAQRAGRLDAAMSPIAAASAMIAMTERVAAFHREIEELGVTHGALVETTARIIDQTVTGPS
ncbi:MAG TPA: TetR family transcriptional regulator [Acidimicrobiia bacterium]|nr:TetR family transcriptional regulator [Acidimicrobiia bacterium]